MAPDTIIAATSHTTMRRAVGGGMHVDAPLIARRHSRGQASSDFLTRPPDGCDQWNTIRNRLGGPRKTVSHCIKGSRDGRRGAGALPPHIGQSAGGSHEAISIKA